MFSMIQQPLHRACQKGGIRHRSSSALYEGLENDSNICENIRCKKILKGYPLLPIWYLIFISRVLSSKILMQQLWRFNFEQNRENMVIHILSQLKRGIVLCGRLHYTIYKRLTLSTPFPISFIEMNLLICYLLA